jgi:hypothetical protein
MRVGVSRAGEIRIKRKIRIKKRIRSRSKSKRRILDAGPLGSYS